MLRGPRTYRTALCSLLFLLLMAGVPSQGEVSNSSSNSENANTRFESLGLRMMAAMTLGEEEAERTAILITMNGLDEPLPLYDGDMIAGYTLRNADEYKVELVKDDEVQMLAIRNLKWVKADPEIKVYASGYAGANPAKASLYSEMPETVVASVGAVVESPEVVDVGDVDVPQEPKTVLAANVKVRVSTEPVRRVVPATNLPPKFRSPMDYTRVSSPFGWRNAPRSRVGTGSTYHSGVDLAAPYGTEVYASASGTVTASGYSFTKGNYVEIRHSSGYETGYFHLSRRRVKVGVAVTAGTHIGDEGSTGISTGPHLHFEIRKNGVALDPSRYVPRF